MRLVNTAVHGGLVLDSARLPSQTRWTRPTRLRGDVM